MIVTSPPPVPPGMTLIPTVQLEALLAACDRLAKTSTAPAYFKTEVTTFHATTNTEH